MNLVKLKIKVKHLALEPSIIRHEERKVSGMNKWDLQHHRKWNVRNEARATQLAIAFLKGKPYKSVEPKLRDKNAGQHNLVFHRVLRMAQKYGKPKTTAVTITNWRNA